MYTKSTSTLSSHDRILLSAKQLFAQHGFENTSTVAIAREAGTSESQLMKHFGNKQGLLVAIMDRGWTSISERVHAVHHTSPADRLLHVLEAVAIELDRDPQMKTLMTLEARRVRKDGTDVLLSRGSRQFRSLLDGILQEMRNEGQIRTDLNLDAVRAAVIGMTEGLLRDLVVANRSELRADYGFEDVQKLLGILVGAFHEPIVQRAKAS